MSAPDQTPFRHLGLADAAGLGRVHLGVAEVELRGLDIRGRRVDLRLRRLGGGDGVVVLLPADRLLLHQRLEPRGLGAGVGEARLGVRQCAFRILERLLVLRRVDRVEELPLLHVGALGVVALLEDALDARSDFHRPVGGDIADVFAYDRHRGRADGDHADLGRRRRPLRGLLLLRAAPGECGDDHQRQRQAAQRAGIKALANQMSPSTGQGLGSSAPARSRASAARMRPSEAFIASATASDWVPAIGVRSR